MGLSGLLQSFKLFIKKVGGRFDSEISFLQTGPEEIVGKLLCRFPGRHIFHILLVGRYGKWE